MSPSESSIVEALRNSDTMKRIEKDQRVSRKIELEMRRETELFLIFKIYNRAAIYSGVQ